MQATLQKRLDPIDFKNLHFYKAKTVKQPMAPNDSDAGMKKLIDNVSVEDRIVQTLFVQVIEPVVDVWADPSSFGSRKGRDAHQALGQLERLLSKKFYDPNQSNKCIVEAKYILKINTKDFLRGVDRD